VFRRYFGGGNMYGKKVCILLTLLLVTITFCGCSSSNNNEKPTANIRTEDNAKQDTTIQPTQSVNNQPTQLLNYPTPDFSNLKDLILYRYQLAYKRTTHNIAFAKEYKAIWEDAIKNSKDIKALLEKKKADFWDSKYPSASTYENIKDTQELKKIIEFEEKSAQELRQEIQALMILKDLAKEKDSLPQEYKQAYDILEEMQMVYSQTEYYTRFPVYERFTYEQFSKQLEEMETKLNELSNKFNTLYLPKNK